jgi:fatty-acyl-CoA synthase
MLDHVTGRYPDREFVVTDERAWTYRQMNDWVARIAAGLLKLGIRPGEHVAVILANYPEFVAVKFAIARVGAVMVPVNFLNRRDEIGYILRQSDAVMLITMDRFRDLDYADALDQLSPGWERNAGCDAFPRLRNVIVFPTGQQAARSAAMPFEMLESAGSMPACSAVEPGSVSDIIYTSGTTGAPKGVLLTHDMMLRSGYGSAYARAFEDGRRILFSLPMYHVYGYVEGLLASMFVGGAIIPQLKFDAGDTLRAVGRHRGTDLLLIPTMTLALIDEQRKNKHDIKSLRTLISSGGRAPAYLWDDIRTWLRPEEITTGYGMTECTASTTVTRPDDPPEKLLKTNGRLRDVGAAGDSARGNRLVDYRTVDPSTGADVALGDVGELVAMGPGVTRGYYQMPEATRAAFTHDGWLRTGDLGRIDADGYLTLEGRLKESYRCGGETVMPTEAEDLLVLHPKVLQAHVVPVPDEKMGEAGAAFIVLRAGEQLQPDELTEYCRKQLARFKVPKYFIPIAAESLPTTPSGRARKFKLSEMAIRTLGLQ